MFFCLVDDLYCIILMDYKWNYKNLYVVEDIRMKFFGLYVVFWCILSVLMFIVS